MAGLLALVAAGCGQMTGIHGQAPAITTIAGVGVTTGLQPGTGLADSGATGDIGGVQGPTISGDNSTLIRGATTRTVTVTEILPRRRSSSSPWP